MGSRASWRVARGKARRAGIIPPDFDAIRKANAKALVDLKSKSEIERLSAARQFGNSLSADWIPHLEAALRAELSPAVRQALKASLNRCRQFKKNSW